MEFSYASIVKCPHCGGLHGSEFPELSVGNGMTKTLWTDGLETGFMINRPQRPFYYCTYTGCEKTFWFDDAEVVHVIRDLNINSCMSAEQKEVQQLYLELCKGVNYMGVDNCYQAIEEGIAGENLENWKCLRKFTWQESTEPLRNIPDIFLSLGSTNRLSERHYDNLSELKRLLDASLENERILALEINRQIGEFKAAADLIEFDWSADNRELINYQKRLIEEKDMLLRRVPS